MQEFGTHSAYSLAIEAEEEERKAKLEEEKHIKREQMINQPLVLELQKQNSLLQKQLEQSIENERRATAEARRAKNFSWLTFAVTTVISLVALLVALLK